MCETRLTAHRIDRALVQEITVTIEKGGEDVPEGRLGIPWEYGNDAEEIMAGFELWVLGNIPPNNLRLMEVAELDRNTSKNPRKTG